MKKIAILLSSALFLNSFSFAQVFTPRVENVNTNQYTLNELQKTGCPKPPININITPDITPITWDYSLRSRDLKNMSTQPGQIVGLHRGFTNVHIQSQVFYLTDNSGVKTCFTIWPAQVTLRLQSKIYISSEAANLHCTKTTTEAHELEHHKVSIWALTEAQNQLYKEIYNAYQKPMYFNTYAEAENYYNSIVSKMQNNFMNNYNNLTQPLNSKLDSQENYQAEGRKCPQDTSTLAFYLSQ